MQTFLVGLMVALAWWLAGELLKRIGEWWFRRKQPLRVDKCPRCGSDNLERKLTRAEEVLFGVLVVIFALTIVATVFAAIADALLLLTTVAGGFGGIGMIAVASAVVVVGWVVLRLVFPPLLRLRGRPPRRCRRCALTFSG
jgi:hypothetical protein